eukprot:5404158-Karenia_brevis.AAC.1
MSVGEELPGEATQRDSSEQGEKRDAEAAALALDDASLGALMRKRIQKCKGDGLQRASPY